MRRRDASDRGLRRRVRDDLRGLGLSSPLDPESLCRRLGARRGRPLVLVPAPLPVPGPFGMWIATGATDTIVYQSETTAAHQLLIVLHEVGHILAGHPGGTEPAATPLPALDDDTLAALFPTLPAHVVRTALGRAHYESAHEREAELVGSIVFEWADRLAVAGYASATTELGRRAQDALEEHTGWV